ncbi:MAG: hypothetical protein Q7O66_06785 [Dehalococcoidia bacterium]|nr:hypothetical protein [Dehalococcoidia bacterium]
MRWVPRNLAWGSDTNTEFFAVDNVTLRTKVEVTHDSSSPTISASAKKSDNTADTADTWTNQSVTVHFTCGDAGSGRYRWRHHASLGSRNRLRLRR